MTLAGWQATDTLLAHARAREEAEQIRDIIGRLALAATADTEATLLDENAAQIDEQVAHAEQDVTEATRRNELAARIEEIENAEHTLQETLPGRRHSRPAADRPGSP